MNDLIKAIKIYLKVSFNIILFTFGIGFSAAIVIGSIYDPAERGDNDYGSMIGCCGMMHGFMMFMFFNGNLRITHTKFFASVPQAKKLFTDAPIAVMAIFCIFIDILLVLSALLRNRPDMASDLLIANSINTVIACIFNAVYGKSKGLIPNILTGVAFILLLNQITLLKRATFINNGFGLSLKTSAAVAAAVYIAGLTAAHFIMQLWWKKSGRNFNNNFNMTLQNAQAESA